ncbi:MAG: hypothetical protein HRT87_03150 [Legionellales bacterium]|nr:hypothetical protein [Legionellales bacterium]
MINLKIKSKTRGEIITLTVAIIGFAAACVPVIYGIYCKHKEYKERMNEFIHSDVLAKNESKYQSIFELISIDMKSGNKRSEFKVTINPDKEEPVPDWIEDKIKKSDRLITAQYTTTHDSNVISCPRLPLNENISYKLVQNMNSLNCEFSSVI